ncbi:MAG: aspartate/glutamate racemase family protein [Treponema sp.]|jgi:glutamate racemase|nr:aspartate/glutamate racemase family protein [Treponema sp.]
MDRRPVVFWDSGIGALPYYAHFAGRNPRETVICVADRAHFPYGTRALPALRALLERLCGRIVARFDPKVLALACNTATVSGIAHLRAVFPDRLFVGTFPAVKPALEESRSGRVILIGTERTVEDQSIDETARRVRPECRVLKEAATALVAFAEERACGASAEERLAAVLPALRRCEALGADGLVLGCTHFLFLRDDFIAAARECGGGVRIYDSVDGVTRRIESLLDERALRAPPDAAPQGGRIFLTGGAPPEPRWEAAAAAAGLSPEAWPV